MKQLSLCEQRQKRNRDKARKYIQFKATIGNDCNVHDDH